MTTLVDTGDGWEEQSALGANAILFNYTGGGTILGTGTEATALNLGTFALTDSRDNKDYLVRRLADGNCWMVQNLDLDLAQYNASNKLPAEKSDIADDWDPTASVNEKINSTYKTQLQDAGLALDFQGLMNWLNGNNTQTQQFQNSTQYSGNWYWGVRRTDATTAYTDITSNTVANNAFSEIPRSYDNTVYGTNNVRYVAMDPVTGKTYKEASTTSTTGWTEGMTNNNAAVATVTDGFRPTEMLTTPGVDATSTADDAKNFYGSMYIGKYYNWYAATAETGKYTMATNGNANSQAEGSICPKGWGLPYDYDYVAGRGNSWRNLLITTYGLTAVTDDGAEETENAMKVRQAPLSLPLSGYYVWSDGNLYNRGYGGVVWSRSASSTAFVRYLSFNIKGRVNPQGNSYKGDGFSVRCVAHGDELTEDAAVIASQDEDKIEPCAAGKICYDKNGGSGSMSDQSASASSSATLTASSFTRLGYAFAGWSTTENGFGGELYGPNETITTPDTLGTTGLQLYAKWPPASTEYTMQTFTAEACNNLGMHQTIALTDNRDGNVYTVAKLKDNNCWMTSNLALNLADFAGTKKLTPENTDLNSTDAVSRGYWDPSESMYTLAKALDSSVTTDQSSYFPVASQDRLGIAQAAQFQSGEQTGAAWNWGSRLNEAGEVLYSNDNNATVANGDAGLRAWHQGSGVWIGNNSRSDMPRSYHDGNNTYGDYYNWYAATAESGKFTTTSGTTVSDSICPKGWKLPVDGGTTTEKSWQGLLYGSYGLDNSTASSRTMCSNPLSFAFMGCYSPVSGSFINRNSGGNWWSATAKSTSNVQNLGFNGWSVYPQANDQKPYGSSVRCILQ